MTAVSTLAEEQHYYSTSASAVALCLQGIEASTAEMDKLNERVAAMTGVRVKKDGQNDDGVSFVLVPADASLPPQELLVVLPAQSAAELANVIEPYFGIQEGETVDMKLLQEQANEARKCTTYMCPHVSPLTLQRAAEEGTVQQCTVSSSNDNGSIYMYWDESANLKQRPVNTRAVEYLQRATQQNDETIHGDVFLARVQEQQPVSLEVDALMKEPLFCQHSG